MHNGDYEYQQLYVHGNVFYIITVGYTFIISSLQIFDHLLSVALIMFYIV